MDVPRIGVSLPHFSPYVSPETVTSVARAAERLGYHALSVTERLLLPVSPQADLKDGLPDAHVWDPIELLTWAAAHTSRIRLTTGVVNAIFQPPIVLARRLATLDRLSRGRLDAGLGQGGGGTEASKWAIPEEFTAAGVPFARRGAGFEEHIAAVRACWGPDPVEFDGKHYRIPRASIGPKPYDASIPLLLGVMNETTAKRAARIADGVIVVALDWAETAERVRAYRAAGGRGKTVALTFQTYPDGGPTPTAFLDAVLADLARAGEAGADEMHVNLALAGVAPADQIPMLEALAGRLGLAGTGHDG